MRHPLDFLPRTTRKPLFFLLLGLTASCFAVSLALNQPLRGAAAPAGQLSFELAGPAGNMAAILDGWDENARLQSAFNLGLGFLILPIFAATLSLSTLLAANRRQNDWGDLGILFGWGALAAGLLGMVENIALFSILNNNMLSPAPQIAFWCAIAKYALILLAVLYSFTGWLFPQRKSSQQRAHE